MMSMVKCFAVAAVIALTTASGAFAYEQGGNKLSGSPSEYTAQQSSPSAWDYFKGCLGSICETITGVDPFVVSETVDMVVESSESLAETADNAEAYFDAYPDAPDRARYTLADEDLSDKPAPGLYKWFWSFFE